MEAQKAVRTLPRTASLRWLQRPKVVFQSSYLFWRKFLGFLTQSGDFIFQSMMFRELWDVLLLLFSGELLGFRSIEMKHRTAFSGPFTFLNKFLLVRGS